MLNKVNLICRTEMDLAFSNARIVSELKDSYNPSKEIFILKETEDVNKELHHFLAVITSKKNCEISNFLLLKDEDIDELKHGDIITVSKMNKGYALIRRIFRSNSSDNVFFLTNSCNSDCIFCPDSIKARSNNIDYLENIISTLDLYPKSLKHVTITGGEPTILKEKFLNFLGVLKEQLPETNYTILSNGRMFYYSDFTKEYMAKKPKKTKVAIPIHGSTPELNDRLSGVKGSYEETLIGINNLLKSEENIELRIVLNKQNLYDLPNIAKLISINFSEVKEVNIMSIELTGNAAINPLNYWVDDKDEINKYLRETILILIKAGIKVHLYNFPLCYIDYEFHPLSQKSITDYKRKYSIKCECCIKKEFCGGFFSSTYELLKLNVYPIK